MIGPTFPAELAAAGLSGSPIVWTAEGDIIGRDLLTAEQNAALESVIAAHDSTRVDLVAYVATARWRRETGGAVWSGMPIHTDVNSQAKYLAELQAISLGVRIDNDGWKFADGVFRSVSNTAFYQLAVAARAHVRACFAAEAILLAGIAAGTITTTTEIDAAFAAI